MRKGSSLNITVITEHKDEIPPTLPKLVSEDIRRNLSYYIWHTTKCYRAGSTNYAVSTIFYVKEDIPVCETHPLLIKACELEGVQEFGSGPSSNSSEPIVCYCICRPNLINAPRESADSIRFVGDCLAALGGDHPYYRVPLIPPFSERVMQAIDASSSPSKKFDTHISRMTLTASRNRPTWFVNKANWIIYAPASAIASTLNLHLEWKRPVFKKTSCPLAISQVTVELYEIRSCVDVSGNCGLLDTYVRGFKKVTLVQSKCWTEFDLSKSRYKIPPHLYQCKLPRVGPTFFSKNMNRNYALKVTVKIECKRNHLIFELSRYVDIAIAKVDRREECHRDKIKDDRRREKCCLLMETFDSYHSDPSQGGAKLLNELSSLRYATYKSHQIYGKYSPKIGVFYTMTWVQASITSKENTYGAEVSDSQIAHALKNESAIIRFKDNHYSYLYGSLLAKLEVHNKSVRFPTYFPQGVDTLFGSDVSSFSLASQRKSFTLLAKESKIACSLCLNLIYTSPCLLHLNYNLILPGMKLSKFASLGLRLRGLKMSEEIPKLSILVKFFCLSIEELRTENSFSVTSSSVISHKVYSLECEHHLTLAPRQYDSHNKEFRLAIPKKWYNQKIPPLGPTFYSHSYFRGYNLKIEMGMVCEGREEQFVVKMPIHLVPPGKLSAFFERLRL